MSVNCRPVHREDLPYLRDIDLKSSETPWTPDEWETAGEKNDFCFVATWYGTPVGFTVVSEMGRIKKLAVHPRHRRRGFGTLLLYRVMELCLERGLSKVSVCVPETECRPGAKGDRCGFLTREGFRGVGVEKSVRNLYGLEEDGFLLEWVPSPRTSSVHRGNSYLKSGADSLV